ncbi:UDP-N-acetylmuramoyl-tripeptide--D-alanyl-D-alanine ligase [Halocynthiibacter styelae]|uniref:UDP-N-acetylmuramoyl-tripeptide--D-alanyl-D-alanine ligase n=1 Tax=Halocynthiibacter styelae TaxID=2761955 RepID=A0A8J7IQF0_9RHOB|nr:UDP-N-acetylmuramoyl-tripeptide--D-alanyl-D-alanine ligase [Paenihalocynthiibacter styelae]MBI1493416.1 UDP-N-acetylmuramoyl-tripeptide--D-alanyl-D-alanine ligase [Paenihalocynthiibacter styelae]
MTLWTAKDAARATGGQAIGDWSVSGISIDTRSIQKGDLFVALKAARDGHDFVAQALEKGAGAALVSRIPEGVSADAPLLLVDDVLAGLEELGRAGRARFQGRVVAITGSVGKTSTKEMLREVLGRQGQVHAAEASFNNHWGVPITLARMPVDADYAVIEIGMNHPGEIAPLAKMARPHVAMITTIAPAHLEAFENIEGIAREKAAIFEGLEPGGVAVLPGDLETSDILKAGQSDPVLFGEGDQPWQVKTVQLSAGQTVITAVIPAGDLVFKLDCAGRHFARNAIGALGAVDALGADASIAAQDMMRWQPPGGRGQREIIRLDPVQDAEIVLLDDAFNANPASMAAALEVLASETAAKRRIAVLGDMLELGPTEIEDHRAVADLAALEEIDLVHCVGPRMKALWDVLPARQRGEYDEAAEDLTSRVHNLLRPGDAVLVKGSKGIKVSLVVDALRRLGDVRPGSEIASDAAQQEGQG